MENRELKNIVSQVEAFHRPPSRSLNPIPTPFNVNSGINLTASTMDERMSLQTALELQAREIQGLGDDSMIIMGHDAYNDGQQLIDPDRMTYEVTIHIIKQLLSLQEEIGFVKNGLSKEQLKKIPKMKFSNYLKRTSTTFFL